MNIATAICFLVLICAQSVANASDRLTLPTEIASQTPGLVVGAGVHISTLNSRGAARASVFSASVAPSTQSVPTSRAGWNYDAFESVRTLTERSELAIQVSAKSRWFRAAASMNKASSLEIQSNALLYTASTRYVVSEARLLPPSNPRPQDFHPDVVALRQQAQQAIDKGDTSTLGTIRAKFAREFGTGYVAETASGGIYFVTHSESFTSKDERDRTLSNLNVSGLGAAGSTSASSSRSEFISNQLFKRSGVIYGGEPSITNLEFEAFRAAAEKWYASVRKGPQVTLSAVVIPYNTIEYLRPLASYPQTSDSEAQIVGYFGTADAPNTAAFVQYTEAGATSFASVPLLVPVEASVGPDGHLRVLFTVNAEALSSENLGRQVSWRETAKKLPDRVRSVALAESDPAVANVGELSPEIVLDPSESRAAFESVSPIGDSISESIANLLDAETARANDAIVRQDMPGWYDFGRLPLPNDNLIGAIRAGRVAFRTVISPNSIAVVHSRPEGAVVKSGNVVVESFEFEAFMSPGLDDSARFGRAVRNEIDAQVKRRVFGPVRSVQATTYRMLDVTAIAGGGYSVYHACEPAWPTVGDDQIHFTDTGPHATLDVTKFDATWKANESSPYPRACKGGGECDSAGEVCKVRMLKVGCIVNREWYEWFMHFYRFEHPVGFPSVDRICGTASSFDAYGNPVASAVFGH